MGGGGGAAERAHAFDFDFHPRSRRRRGGARGGRGPPAAPFWRLLHVCTTYKYLGSKKLHCMAHGALAIKTGVSGHSSRRPLLPNIYG